MGKFNDHLPVHNPPGRAQSICHNDDDIPNNLPDQVALGLVGPIGARDALYHTSLFSQLINGADRSEWEAAGFHFTHGRSFRDARVVSLWTPDPEEALLLGKLCSIPKPVKHYKDLLGQVSGVLICNAGGDLIHAKWAKFFVEHDVPVYVDKPIAGSLGESEDLINLAKDRDALLMSCSGFRYSSVLSAQSREIAALGKIWLASATCPLTEGDLSFYGIHALEPVHALMGRGVEWVQNTGDSLRHIVRAAYPDGRSIVLQCLKAIAYTVHVSLFGEHGSMNMHLIPDDEFRHQYFHRKMLHTFVDMIRSGKRPIELDDTLEIHRILFLGQESMMKEGARIRLCSG